jgi:uncharacterized protein involved in outer membrane biogenesis
MKKLLLGIAVLLLIAIAGSVWWLYNSLDAQVASAIRQYGPEIAGVSISLSDVKIAPVDGSAALRGLVVGNPDGFKTKQALSFGEISMRLDIGSLTTDVIRIKELALIKPEVTYEYASGGSNLDVLQRNIERYLSQQSAQQKKVENSEPRKKLVIEHLYIKNAQAHVSANALQSNAVSIPLPDLHLKDIGKKSNGATAGEAARQVLNTITQQVTQSVASLSVSTAGKTLQKGVEAASKTIKDLFK